MKWIAIVLGLLALFGLVVAVIGARLPRTHSASRQARLQAPPEAVWRAITDVDRFPQWRQGVKRIERRPDRDGRAVWTEHGRGGALTLAVEAAQPPRLLVVRIADEHAPFGGTWKYLIEAAPGGSLLTITEDGEIYNPVFRFVARYVLGYDATLAAYVASLEQLFASEAPS